MMALWLLGPATFEQLCAIAGNNEIIYCKPVPKIETIYNYLSVLVAQLVERPPGLTWCVRKRSVRPSSLDPLDSSEIPFSKELTVQLLCSNEILFGKQIGT